MQKINLGFGPKTIQMGEAIYNAPQGGRWVPKIAQQVMGQYYLEYDKLNMVRYYVQLRSSESFTEHLDELQRASTFYEIPEGFDPLAKHFIKMKQQFNIGQKYLNNDDLKDLASKDFKTFVVLRNLTEPFDIYNQGHDDFDKYELIRKTNKKCFIKTKKHPYAKREEDLQGNPNIKIEKDKIEDGYYSLEVNNENVGILNKVAIFVSSKPPAIHCGEYALILSSGNKFYIYAIEFNDLKWNQKMENKVGQWNNASIVVGLAYTKDNLRAIMNNTLNWFKSNLDVRYCCGIYPEHDFEEQINWIVDLGDDDINSEALDDFNFF